MRTVWVAAALVGLTLTGCGATVPTGDEVPAPSSTTPSTGSSVASSTTEVPGEPYDPEATVRPELMTITPSDAAPGDRIELTFPAETMRGVAYVLERAAGAGWTTTHFLTASAAGYDGEPSWVAAGDPDGYGWEDIGIAGPGPDVLTIPDDAGGGAYRICTANAVENFCAEITVVDGVAPVAPPPAGTTPSGVPVTTVPGTTDPAGSTPPVTTVPVPIVAVHEDVAFYPACGNETLTFDGVTWYQLNFYDGYDEEYAAIYQAFADADREPSPVTGPRGFARVVAPGPGDDIGTLVIWADGVARWVSDSGDLDTWMVDAEIVYLWEC